MTPAAAVPTYQLLDLVWSSLLLHTLGIWYRYLPLIHQEINTYLHLPAAASGGRQSAERRWRRLERYTKSSIFISCGLEYSRDMAEVGQVSVFSLQSPLYFLLITFLCVFYSPFAPLLLYFFYSLIHCQVSIRNCATLIWTLTAPFRHFDRNYNSLLSLNAS